MDNTIKAIIINFVFIINLLAILPLIIPDTNYANSINNPFNNIAELDYTTLFTDIATFIVTGILAFVAIRISQWVVNNSKWKGDRETFELQQQNTNTNLTNAIRLLVDDLKATKDKYNTEIKEIESDFQALNTKVTIHEERIVNIKERLSK